MGKLVSEVPFVEPNLLPKQPQMKNRRVSVALLLAL